MISIIIPVLNEEQGIAALLQHLVDAARQPDALEIIIVDGGSVDYSVDIVYAFAKAQSATSIQVIQSPKGRGMQMHTGATHAKGDVLYFLHADSYPPYEYDTYLIKAITDGHPAGCFRMQFNSHHWWLRLIGWFTRFSWRVSRGGDQSQYITRELYDSIGGYNTTIPVYEDYELIHKLYDNNTYYVIPQWLTTSARRYKNIGVFKLQWLYLQIHWKKWRGASVDEVYEFYKERCGK